MPHPTRLWPNYNGGVVKYDPGCLSRAVVSILEAVAGTPQFTPF